MRTRPAAFDADSNLYNHESGNSANGAAMGDFLESYDFEIDGAGDSLFFMRKLVPDLVEQEGNILVTVKGRKYPHGPQVARNALTLTPTTPYVRPRLRARQGSIRIESDPMNPNAYWRTGMWRADGKSDGHR